MASGTYELNDAAVQVAVHVDRNNRTVLTITDSVDVAILIGGERMRQAIREALEQPVLQAGENEAVIVAQQLREGMRFQTLGSCLWHTVGRTWPPDAFGSVAVECIGGGGVAELLTVYLDAAEQVLVQVPPCPGSEMFEDRERIADAIEREGAA